MSIHMYTVMCIECASNPVCCVHMNPLEIQWASNVHRFQTSNPPQEVGWKWIQTGFHYYSWFKCGYTYHEIFGLLVGLACDECYIAIFCSALAATLGQKEACSLMVIPMVLLCYFVSTYTCSTTQTSEQPSSIVLVSWCRFFQHFDMYHTHAHHYSLQICLPVVPCERDRCASDAHSHIPPTHTHTHTHTYRWSDMRGEGTLRMHLAIMSSAQFQDKVTLHAYLAGQSWELQ